MAAVTRTDRDQARQVFRQFAWHLAGAMAKPAAKAGGKPERNPVVRRSARSAGRRAQR